MGLTKRSHRANLGVANTLDTAPFRRQLFGFRALAFGDAGALCIQDVLRGCGFSERFVVELAKSEAYGLLSCQPVATSEGVQNGKGLRVDVCRNALLTARLADFTMLSHTLDCRCTHNAFSVTAYSKDRVG